MLATRTTSASATSPRARSWCATHTGKVAPPPLPAIEPARYATWDVSGVGEMETGAVRSFLERRAQLRPHARHALAQQLAQQLRPHVAGARPGLDDETFLEHFAAAKARTNDR